jgi:hypothetical protein
MAPLLRPGFPTSSETPGRSEWTYIYRGPTALLNVNKPKGGEEWVGGSVARASVTPVDGMDVGRSTLDPLHLSDLEVVVQISTNGSTTLVTRAERITYGLRWVAVELELETHKKFRTGGAWALTKKDLLAIAGWRAETDIYLKTYYKFVPRDGDGNPTHAVVTINPASNAYKFILLLQRGHDRWECHVPVWTRKTTYRGSLPPETDDLGLKETPPGPMRAALKAAYQWRKSADDCTNTQDTNRWDREEAWQGANKVYIDKDEIYLDDEEFPDGE